MNGKARVVELISSSLRHLVWARASARNATHSIWLCSRNGRLKSCRVHRKMILSSWPGALLVCEPVAGGERSLALLLREPFVDASRPKLFDDNPLPSRLRPKTDRSRCVRSVGHNFNISHDNRRQFSVACRSAERRRTRSVMQVNNGASVRASVSAIS